MVDDLQSYEWADQAKWFIGDRNSIEYENWLLEEKNKLYKHRTQNGDVWLVGSPIWWQIQAQNLPRGGTMQRFKPRLVAKGKKEKTQQAFGKREKFFNS